MANTPAHRVGRQAERVFDGWADAGGFSAARLDPDQHGIDRLFELPTSGGLAPGVGLDSLARDIRGFLQVKGSAARRRSRKVKLSNWRRFVDDDFPCFFLGVRVAADGSPLAAHVVHVDEAQVARVLKELRALDPSDAARLHDFELDVLWTADTELAAVTSEAFVERVRGMVGDPGTYAARKKKWRDTVGYNARSQTIVLNLRATPMELAEASVGDRQLHVEIKRHTDVRFGIERDVLDGIPAGEAWMEFKQKEAIRAELCVRGNARPVVLSGEMLVPWGMGLTAPDRFIRFRTAGLDITFKGARFDTMLFRHVGLADDAKPLPLRSLANVSRALRLLILDRGSWHLAVEGRDLPLAPLRPNTGDASDEMLRAAACFEWAETTATETGVPEDIVVVPAQVLEQAASFAIWAAHLRAVDSAEIMVDAPEYRAGPAVITISVQVRLGPYVLVQPLAFRDEQPRREGDRLSLRAIPWMRGPAQRLDPSRLSSFDPLVAVKALEDQIAEDAAHILIEDHDSIAERWKALLAHL